MKYDYVSERSGPELTVRVPQDVLPFLKKFESKRQEHFLVLSLKGNNTVARLSIISIGTANKTLVHPRDVFLHAIKENAVAMILAHNHPSGSLEPSEEDRDVTNRLKKAGEIMGIHVLDHLIFNRKGYLSFVERGLLNT